MWGLGAVAGGAEGAAATWRLSFDVDGVGLCARPATCHGMLGRGVSSGMLGATRLRGGVLAGSGVKRAAVTALFEKGPPSGERPAGVHQHRPG